MGVGTVRLGGPVGFAVPRAFANPVAPLKIPVPPVIVSVLENVGSPIAFGGPNNTESLPLKLSAPALNVTTKLFSAETGIKMPAGIFV